MDATLSEHTIFRLSNAIVGKCGTREVVAFAEAVEDEILKQASGQAGLSREELDRLPAPQIRLNSEIVRWYHVVVETVLERLQDSNLASPLFWNGVAAGGSFRSERGGSDGSSSAVIQADTFVQHLKPHPGGWAASPYATGKGDRGKRARKDGGQAGKGPDHMLQLAQSLDEALSWPRVAPASGDLDAERAYLSEALRNPIQQPSHWAGVGDEDEVRRVFGGGFSVRAPRESIGGAASAAAAAPGMEAAAAAAGLGLDLLLGEGDMSALGGAYGAAGAPKRGRGGMRGGPRGRGSRAGFSAGLQKASILSKFRAPDLGMGQGLGAQLSAVGLSASDMPSEPKRRGMPKGGWPSMRRGRGGTPAPAGAGGMGRGGGGLRGGRPPSRGRGRGGRPSMGGGHAPPGVQFVPGTESYEGGSWDGDQQQYHGGQYQYQEEPPAPPATSLKLKLKLNINRAPAPQAAAAPDAYAGSYDASGAASGAEYGATGGSGDAALAAGATGSDEGLTAGYYQGGPSDGLEAAGSGDGAGYEEGEGAYGAGDEEGEGGGEEEEGEGGYYDEEEGDGGEGGGIAGGDDDGEGGYGDGDDDEDGAGMDLDAGLMPDASDMLLQSRPGDGEEGDDASTEYM